MLSHHSESKWLTASISKQSIINKNNYQEGGQRNSQSGQAYVCVYETSSLMPVSHAPTPMTGKATNAKSSLGVLWRPPELSHKTQHHRCGSMLECGLVTGCDHNFKTIIFLPTDPSSIPNTANGSLSTTRGHF